MNTRSNPPVEFFSKDDLPVRTRKGKKETTNIAESNPERESSSESEEEGSVSDMPPPDQDPPKLPDLEVIRNRRSISRAKSMTKTQAQESKLPIISSSWLSSSKPENTWRDQRAESAQREQRRKEEYWNRDQVSRIPKLRRAKSTSSLNEVYIYSLEISTHF